jgi:hypothetical protein
VKIVHGRLINSAGAKPNKETRSCPALIPISVTKKIKKLIVIRNQSEFKVKKLLFLMGLIIE